VNSIYTGNVGAIKNPGYETHCVSMIKTNFLPKINLVMYLRV